MTDGSETRYSPAIRAEIERRWQELARPGAPFGWPKTSFGIISDLGADPYSHCADGWHTWLATHLHAQEDVQILLEGLATAERSLLAATARIAEVEGLRREDADRCTDALCRVGEANLELRAIIEEERKEAQVEAGRYAEAIHDTLAERDLARGLAQRRKVVLERLLMLGVIPEGELLRAVREEVG